MASSRNKITQSARDAAYAEANVNARELHENRMHAPAMVHAGGALKLKNNKLAKRLARRVEPREQITNDASRLIEDFEIGSVSHQGDLIIISIGTLPQSAKPRKNRQLADGDTQGSRHVLDRGEIFDADPEAVASLILKATTAAGCPCHVDARYVGPVFRSPADPTAEDLTHPEHGNQGFPAGVVCAVVYQRNLDAEEREQRSLD